MFTKGLSQISGLTWLYCNAKVKLIAWLRPLRNTVPETGGKAKLLVIQLFFSFATNHMTNLKALTLKLARLYVRRPM